MRTKFTACLSMLIILMGLATVPGFSTKAEAAGFAIYEWGARGNALGGAVVAKADDPSAIAWNPAGITQLEGTHIQAGVAMISPKMDLTTTYNGVSTKSSMTENSYFPPSAYITHQINDNLWLGVGTFTRFGLGTEFDENWAGRYASYNTAIESYSFNPNLAYKFNEYVSIAAGLEFMKVRADLRKKLDASTLKNPNTYTFDVDQRIIVNGFTPGANAAIHITPTDQWSIGLSWRSKMSHSASGSASYNPSAAAAAAAPNRFHDTDIIMSMKTPHMFFGGLEYKPLDNLSFEFDAIWSLWSDYSHIRYEFENTNAIGTNTVISDKKWNDVWRFQFGVEYLPIEDLSLRVGYFYDQSPIPDGYIDYMLPTSDRQNVSLGIGWKYENFTIDAAYNYLWMKDRTIEARPTEGILQTEISNSRTHIVSLDLGFEF
ncbi:OmpP1/FadL family transporter [Maridesulfovibrio salexigens]|uniref:Membrane protein involved in aromatic hydrocarbon degradation n=1 Tax=Maridesulfovibrio salexigens (strain ATCC 14822 / DSM 2638 / NCIMB 8403 / VKM B-1763) TaxID=526222 RepID=C6BVB6_MARSD|nr:outer membrane protein transport protein [Maridesulfovibrio salexigens]ACS80091.1 membrane protein involved in aromatic hydrocarbon degradation [Maridesulfovibrio salexigens DSM 2638]